MCGLGDGAMAHVGETLDAASAAPEASSSRLFIFHSPSFLKKGG
jgi:hypothetical protein